MDQLLFSDSHETSKSVEPFTSRQLSYIIDQNNSSYSSGQVQIDTSLTKVDSVDLKRIC